MMSLKEQMMDSMTSRLLLFFQKNSTDSQANKNNGTLSAEDFITGLFNILYEKGSPEYVNTKKIKKNYPGIDVLSIPKKQGVQVTVQTDSAKIKKTFNVIPAHAENVDYSEVLFVIQASVLPKNLKRFKSNYEGYRIGFFSATEILREIDMCETDHIKKMCAYIEGAVVMPSTVMDGTNVDAEVFKILFTSLNDLLQKESMGNIDDDEEPAYKTSPAQKKEKFKKHWPVLEQVYKDSLGLKADGSESGRLIAYHKYVEEAFSQDLSEDDKEVIQSYLKTKSALILHENNDDPIKAIHQMASTMSKELDLGFIPSSHVLSFVLNMFFKCDVFPLLMETP